jgi:uncharacterized protein YjaZ
MLLKLNMFNVKVSEVGEYAKIFNFIDNQQLFDENQTFVEEVIKWMETNTLDYGGFKLKDKLNENLTTLIEATDKSSSYFNQEKISQINELVRQNLELARKEIINPNVINIFIFPTQSEFTLDVMKGITGWCPSKDSIHLHIHPETNLTIPLSETVVHEYNHTVFRSYHDWDTVEEGLVAEGLAEHFRESLLGGETAPWAASLDQEEAFSWLEKIQPVLKSTNEQDYVNVFTNFEDDPYPHWIGYAIGYQLVKIFREKNNLSWQDLTELPVKQVLTTAN